MNHPLPHRQGNRPATAPDTRPTSRPQDSLTSEWSSSRRSQFAGPPLRQTFVEMNSSPIQSTRPAGAYVRHKHAKHPLHKVSPKKWESFARLSTTTETRLDFTRNDYERSTSSGEEVPTWRMNRPRFYTPPSPMIRSTGERALENPTRPRRATARLPRPPPPLPPTHPPTRIVAETFLGELGRERIKRRNTISTSPTTGNPTTDNGSFHKATEVSHIKRSSSDPVLPNAQIHNRPLDGDIPVAPNAAEIAEMVRNDIRGYHTQADERPSPAPSRTRRTSTHPPLPRHFYSTFQTNSSPYSAEHLWQYSFNSINRRGNRSNSFTSILIPRRPLPGASSSTQRTVRGVATRPTSSRQHPSLQSSFSSSRDPSRPTTSASQANSSTSSTSHWKSTLQTRLPVTRNVENLIENGFDHSASLRSRSNAENILTTPEPFVDDAGQPHTNAPQSLETPAITKDTQTEISLQPENAGTGIASVCDNEETPQISQQYVNAQAMQRLKQKKEALKTKLKKIGEKLKSKRDYWRSRTHKLS